VVPVERKGSRVDGGCPTRGAGIEVARRMRDALDGTDEPAEALLVKGGPGQVGQEKREEERRRGDRSGQVQVQVQVQDRTGQDRTGEKSKLTIGRHPSTVSPAMISDHQQEAAEGWGAGAGVGVETMSREMISSIQCQDNNQAINAIRSKVPWLLSCSQLCMGWPGRGLLCCCTVCG
jgi:hypothetical protein